MREEGKIWKLEPMIKKIFRDFCKYEEKQIEETSWNRGSLKFLTNKRTMYIGIASFFVKETGL